MNKNKNKILDAYQMLAKPYNDVIDHKPHNAYYDRPNTLRLVGNVANKKVLDAACGPGKYAEILISKGAEVIGFDLSPKMIDLATKRNKGKGSFFVHDLEKPLPQLESASFDVLICALAMHYIPDWTSTLKEFRRLLKPEAILVLSIEHPFFEYTYFNSEKYFEIEAVKATWSGFGEPVEVNSFRRSLQDCINPIIRSGFALEEILEPLPVEEFKKRDPRHYKELLEFPAFMHIKAKKI